MTEHSCTVYVLWKYEGEMQISYGTYPTIRAAKKAWQTIQRDCWYRGADGLIHNFAPPDFLDHSWIIEAYTAGREQKETYL